MLKISLLLRKIQLLRVNNLRILMIKNAKFSGYYFYMNLTIWRDFQFCISVPLNNGFKENSSLNASCVKFKNGYLFTIFCHFTVYSRHYYMV